MEWAHSVVSVKPFVDVGDVDIHLLFMDIVNKMKNDNDRDVIEAVDQCDYKLLQQKKRTKEEEKLAIQIDNERIDMEAKLVIRE